MCEELDYLIHAALEGEVVSNSGNHQTARHEPAHVYAPQNARDVQAIVRCAESQDPPVRVRACGSRWSLNGSASVDTDGYLIVPDGLTRSIGITTRDVPNSNLGNVSIRANAVNETTFGLARAQSGMEFREFASWINESGAVIPTRPGGADRARLAGITATGTHGSDLALPCLADYVRAVHLVGSGGQEYWIEGSGSNRITDGDDWAWSGLELIRDDEVLAGTIVAVGRLGVIVDFVYEVFEVYWTETRISNENWFRVRDDFIRGRTASDLFSRWTINSPEPLPLDLALGPTNLRTLQIDLTLGAILPPDKTCTVTRSRETPSRVELLRPGFFQTPEGDFDVALLGAFAVDNLDILQVLVENGRNTAEEIGMNLTQIDNTIAVLSTISISPLWLLELDQLMAARIIWVAVLTSPPALADPFGAFHLAVALGAIRGFMSDFAEEMRALIAGSADQDQFLTEEVYPRLTTLIFEEFTVNQRTKLLEFFMGVPLADFPTGVVTEPSNVAGTWPPLPAADSLEYAFDASNTDGYTQLVDFALQMAAPDQVMGWISLRFTAGSRSMLAMQRFENTVSVEISMSQDPRTPSINIDFVDECSAMARSLDGIPHWGQMHEFSDAPQELQSYYGDSLSRWRRVLRRLTRRGNPLTFENEYCRLRGLTVPRASRDSLLFSSYV